MNPHHVGGARARARLRVLVAALACGSVIAGTAPWTVGASPPTTEPPDVRFVVNAALGTDRVPVRVTWPRAVAGDAPIARYQLQHRFDEGTWRAVALSSATARAATVSLRPGTLNQFRVRAGDTGGLYGSWAGSEPLWLAVVPENVPEIVLTGSWTPRAVSSALGGRLASSEDPAARASYSFTGTRLAWISQRAPTRGRAEVSIDGNPVATVDLRRSTSQPRRIVFARAWAAPKARTLSIAVEGTDGRPRVDVDAIVTLGPPPTSVLVGAGDIATCSGGGDERTADIVDDVAGTVFTAGDNAYPNGTPADFENCYGPSWGRFQERTRPSPGNHDYAGTSTGTGYFDYFGANAGPRGKGWYAYDSGTWRIYSLNSNCTEAGGCGTTSPQYTWLANDLAANSRRCVAAYWHHPRFSSGPHGGSTRMKDVLRLLYDRGADLVIGGHDHSYERFAPITPTGAADSARGIRHFIVGTGGAGLYAAGPNPAPNSQLLETQTHGVLKLTLEWDSYSWRFLPAAGGTFTDSGTGDCH